MLLVPSFASGQVSVRPRESKPGAEERDTVRVPTEGDVATTHVILEIPIAEVVRGLAGAKWLWVAAHFSEEPLLDRRGGMSWFGGCAGGVLARLTVMQWKRLHTAWPWSIVTHSDSARRYEDEGRSDSWHSLASHDRTDH